MYNSEEKRGSELSLKDFFRTPIDYYDKFKPRSGIRYKLSQTEANYRGDMTKFHLTSTHIEFEPGQDLSEPNANDGPVQYAPSRSRGPVIQFKEEIEERRTRRMRWINAIRCQEMLEELQIANRLKRRAIHKKIIGTVGPPWFQELSNAQFKVADNLKNVLLKDFHVNTIIHTQEALTDLGIVLRPNESKIRYALDKCYNCPIEFLLTLFKIMDPERKQYSLNDKIILSAVVHLTIRDTLKELHLRIPSPPRVVKKVKKIRRRKVIINKKLSPYIQPFPFLKKSTKTFLYKNRHKEYASSRYFDYVDEMYEEVEDPNANDVIPVSESQGPIIISKYAKPPKIPVRLITRIAPKPVMIRRLIKPSAYLSNCKRIELAEMAQREAEEGDNKNKVTEENIKVTTEIDLKKLCTCSTNPHNKDYTLNIKISSGSERILLKQDFNPYKDTTGPLVVQKFEKKVPAEKNKELSVVADLVEKCTCAKEEFAIPDKICTCADNKLVFCGQCGASLTSEEEILCGEGLGTDEKVICLCQKSDTVEEVGNLNAGQYEFAETTICLCKEGGDGDVSGRQNEMIVRGSFGTFQNNADSTICCCKMPDTFGSRIPSCNSETEEDACACKYLQDAKSAESACKCEGILNDGSPDGCQCEKPKFDCPCGGLGAHGAIGKEAKKDSCECIDINSAWKGIDPEKCTCSTHGTNGCQCLEKMNLRQICKCPNPRKTVIKTNPSKICACNPLQVDPTRTCSCSKQQNAPSLRCTCEEAGNGEGTQPCGTALRCTCGKQSEAPSQLTFNTPPPEQKICADGKTCLCDEPTEPAAPPTFKDRIEKLIDRPNAPKTCTCHYDPMDPSTHVPKRCTCDLLKRGIKIPEFVCRSDQPCEGGLINPRHERHVSPTQCTCQNVSTGVPSHHSVPGTCSCQGEPSTTKCKCGRIVKYDKTADSCTCKCICGQTLEPERPKAVNPLISRMYEEGREMRLRDIHATYLRERYEEEQRASLKPREIADVLTVNKSDVKGIFKRSNSAYAYRDKSLNNDLNREKTKTKLQFTETDENISPNDKFLSDQGVAPITRSGIEQQYQDFEEMEEVEIVKDSPTCICEKLYNEFILEHDECLLLYDEYEYQMLQEVDRYLAELKPDTCGCTDTDKYAPTTPPNVCDLLKEEKGEIRPQKYCLEPQSEWVCECGTQAGFAKLDETEDPVVCDCVEMLEDDDGCICFKTGEDEPHWDLSPCSCPKPYICECKRDGEKKKKIKKKDGEDGEVEFDEDDPRIFKIHKFPVTPEGQMKLLKKALAALAKDNYPLAKLPECWKLPIFQLWLNFRSQKYVSMEDRAKLTLNSMFLWNHIRLCNRRVNKPYLLGLTREQLNAMTWKAYKKYHNMIADQKTDYYRRLKRAYISEAREFFPTLYHHYLPTQSFRDCFFAYLPSDENHMHCVRPWMPHEVKNMKFRKPCL